MQSESRRGFLKKAVYVAPVIVSLNALPAFAGIGSSPDNRPPDNRPPDNRPPDNRPPQ